MEVKKMPTIHDIARMSGYSASTVSRVLNQKNHVSKEAEEAIRRAIKELDYVPSDIARDLSRGKTLNIGIVLPHTKHPFFTDILTGAINASFLTDYHLVILPSAYEEKRERGYLEQLRSRAFDGLIFTSHGLPLETLAKYQKYGPIVCCEKPYGVNISAVYSERSIALNSSLKWLRDNKYKQIGFFLSREEKISATSKETLGAYRTIFNQEPESDRVKTGVATYEDGYQKAKEWHEEGVTIEVIFSNGDDIVAGARQFYLDHQLKMPYLVGQENQLSSQLMSISTIDYQFLEIGKKAFELVLKENGVEQVSVPSRFILREQVS